VIVGETIFKFDGNDYHTWPWSRRGLAATFVIRVMQVSGSPIVTVAVEHKNREDISWSALQFRRRRRRH
jgi:hypothetical protein